MLTCVKKCPKLRKKSKREMSSEISGGTFEWTRPPDWPTQIWQICVGQSGGLVHSNVPPEILLDISLLNSWFFFVADPPPLFELWIGPGSAKLSAPALTVREAIKQKTSKLWTLSKQGGGGVSAAQQNLLSKKGMDVCSGGGGQRALSNVDFNKKVYILDLWTVFSGLQKRCDLPNTQNDTLEPS